MLKIKIIFLDIDGVLNSVISQIDNHKRGRHPINEHFGSWSVLALNKILEKTNAKIVISSSWGVGEKLYRAFKNSGIDSNKIVDEVPSLLKGYGYRGREIEKFLNMTEIYISNFVIIDDNNDMKPFMNKLYKTNAEIGLNYLDVEPIIKILNEKEELLT